MSHEPDLDTARLPRHIGLIMDGNGRWARRRNMSRSAGHREGLVAAKRIVAAAAELGIAYLSLYTFSTENWKRTEDEVSFLMGLVRMNLRKEYEFYQEHGIRLRYSGDPDGLPAEIREDIMAAVAETRHFGRLNVILAINYGGRNEIARAVNRWLAAREGGRAFTEADLSRNLDNPDVPDPDLIIRTAGEQRISNFLLWQAAYAEFHACPKLWPDFTPEDFRAALSDYQSRTRTYGGLT